MSRIRGLDAIRFICALIVVLGHFSGRFINDFVFLGHGAAYTVNACFALLLNGQAAVIVFFVLSGFVIHRPYAEGKKFILTEYYSRRFFRIVPPVIVIVTAYFALKIVPHNNNWNSTPLWSIICEIIYYIIYPLIIVKNKINKPVFPMSICATLVFIFYNYHTLVINQNIQSLGYWTAVIGFPSWLMGCLLAERVGGVASLSTRLIWLPRLGILAGGAMLLIFRYYAKGLGIFASNAITLNIFALFITAWLGLEIAYRARHTQEGHGFRALEQLGKASYSLYLVHMPVKLILLSSTRNLQQLALFGVVTAAATFIFYMLVERPSHIVAQRLGRHFATRASLPKF